MRPVYPFIMLLQIQLHIYSFSKIVLAHTKKGLSCLSEITRTNSLHENTRDVAFFFYKAGLKAQTVCV